MAARGSDGAEDPKGLYAILGVPGTADEAEIRKAYRRLALRWHPDKNPDNPEATAEFQKISSAYEVLSDPERREMYNTTGCIDAEELNEAGNFDHAADLFAAFFGGVGSTDLDAEEQSMLDEFLRIAGGGAFRSRGSRARGKKGKVGKGKKGARAAQAQEEQMMADMFMAAMGGDLGMEAPPAASCPQGHPLKKRKADAEYCCDLCEVRIPEGKRIMDCRKCDFSVCMGCHKKAEAEAVSQQQEEELGEMLEAFCEMNTTPVRQGRRLQFRCDLCNKLLESQEAVVEHMGEKHEDEFTAALEEEGPMGAMGAMGAMGPMGPMGAFGPDMFGGGGLEELFMAASMEDLLGGNGGPPPRGAAPPSGGGRRRGPKRRG